MPMPDAYIPPAARPPAAGRELLSKITGLPLHHAGADPPAARALAWVFVHRRETRAAAPQFRG